MHIVRQIHCQRITTHIDGENAAEQTGVQTQGTKARNNDSGQTGGNQRSQADNPCHGQGDGSKKLKGLFKPLPESEAVSQKMIHTAN